MTSMIDLFVKEFETEAKTTRKMLAIVPKEKFDWKPHPKSMTLRSLATHVAELPAWASIVLTTDELDFAKAPYAPEVVTDANDLLALFEKSMLEAKAQLIAKNESKLNDTWTLRNGDQILSVQTKAENVRHAISQSIHHRAQLGVFLRLLDIPIPGSYGPSADDMNM